MAEIAPALAVALVAHRVAADVPTQTIVDLGLVYGPIVAAFGLVSVWCYTHYRLTRERHAEILKQLAGRRAPAGTSPDAQVSVQP